MIPVKLDLEIAAAIERLSKAVADEVTIEGQKSWPPTKLKDHPEVSRRLRLARHAGRLRHSSNARR
jgi:hypothetical protein